MRGAVAPRATILVPSHNHARFVLGAVQSALDQTEPAIEVLVIDDGSTDDSVARLAAVDDSRLTVLAQPNSGLSRTLNRGLALARAPWIKFLPSDDMLAPRCVERELETAASAPGVGLVFCLPEVVDGDGRPLADPVPQAWFDTEARDEAALLRGLVERNFLSAPGALFDRDLARAVGGFDPEMRVAQDYDLWLKMLPRCGARLVAERLVRVRWHGANQSGVATPATEAERARALGRALEAYGVEAWVERFAAGRGGDARAGRLDLALALVRSGLAEVRPLARELAVAARRDRGALEALAAADLAALDRGAEGQVSEPYPSRRMFRAVFELAARAARAWQRSGRSKKSSRGLPVPQAREAAPGQGRAVPPGPREHRWLVLAGESPGSGGRTVSLAVALAERGVGVTLATLATAGGETRRSEPLSPASGEVETVEWAPAELRRRLVACRDDRLCVLVGLPHPEAVALAREAAVGGARVVYDRVEAWESMGDLAWYDVETERALVRASDDLVAAGRRPASWLAAARRPVHLLPSPAAAEPASSWETLAASLEAIVARPTVAVILVCRGRDDPGAVERSIDGLLARRGLAAHRIVVVASGTGPGLLERLAAREAAGGVVVLRSAHPSPVAARDLALRATASEIAAFVGVGATPTRDGWLEPAVELLREHREVGAVGCGVAFARAAERAAGPSGPAEPAAPTAEPLAGPGPLLVVPRATLAAAGGFDESLSCLEAADLDLLRRLRATGYRLAVCQGLVSRS